MRLTPMHERARDRLWDQWGRRSGINAIGLGERTRRGVRTNTPAVVVCVTRKYPEALLRPDEILPKVLHVDGAAVEVDVIRAGPFRLAWLDEEYSPPFPGVSIEGAYLGTLGAWVLNGSGQQLLLSAAHVLTGAGITKSPSLSNTVIQPWGVEPNGSINTIATPTTIAEVVASAYGPTGNNSNPGSTFVDCAVALPSVATSPTVPCYLMTSPVPNAAEPAVGLVVATDIEGTQPTSADNMTVVTPIGPVMSILECTFPQNAMSVPQPGTGVQKFGASSAYTSNLVAITGATVAIADVWNTVATNQMLVPRLAVPGDSGALVTTSNGTAIVGPPPVVSPCALLSSLATGLDIPDILNHVGDVDQLRDQWLNSFSLGMTIVGAYYMNQTTILNRFSSSISAMGSDGLLASFQSLAQQYYQDYAPTLYSAIEDPAAAAVFSSSEYQQLSTVLSGLLAYDLISDAEYNLGADVLSALVDPAVGMSYSQLYNYASSTSVFTSAMSYLQQLAALGSISLAGPNPIPLNPPSFTPPSGSKP